MRQVDLIEKDDPRILGALPRVLDAVAFVFSGASP